mgnify:CR=1 FL=1
MVTKHSDPNQSAIAAATKSRAKFSDYGDALGAAGEKQASFHSENCDSLTYPGQSIAISPGDNGFQAIKIKCEWDNIHVVEAGFFGKLLKKAQNKGVDLDLGCLYEMQDGSRGCIQAFGKKFGSFESAPFMRHTGDERTGDADGIDEAIIVNGQQWDKIKRLLIYIYIYEGAPSWSKICPKIYIDVPGNNDLVVTLNAHNDQLALCAIGGVENIRGGIKLTNYAEYFPGHAEMDRAFGFGLDWVDGQKS